MKISDHELYLDRNELIYLTRLLGSKSIIGVNIPELSQDEPEIKHILESAEGSLLKAEAIEIKKDKSINLTAGVLDIIKTAAFRNLSILIIRSIKGIGLQQFTYNFLGNSIQEHTLPDEHSHRFAFIKNQDGLFERLKTIIPLNSVSRENRKEIIILESVLAQIRAEIQKGNVATPAKILTKLGLNEKYTSTFINALKAPKFSVSIAAFQMHGDEIKDTSSFSIFADEVSSWGIWPNKLSEKDSEFLIFPSGINDVFSAFNDWISTLHKKSES